ncbi:hypothetical protein Tco_0675834, partial [Tanacetum coccineum]
MNHQLSLNEKLTFQANEIYEKDEKLKRYRRIGMKAVKEMEQFVPPEVYVSTPITSNEQGVSDSKSKEVEPSCVSHIKTPRQPIKDQATPKVNRKNWNAMMERELGEGYSFTEKKCFVCGSLSHLISSVPPEVYVSTPITSNEQGVSDSKSKEVEP